MAFSLSILPDKLEISSKASTTRQYGTGSLSDQVTKAPIKSFFVPVKADLSLLSDGVTSNPVEVEAAATAGVTRLSGMSTAVDAFAIEAVTSLEPFAASAVLLDAMARAAVLAEEVPLEGPVRNLRIGEVRISKRFKFPNNRIQRDRSM